MYGIYEIMPILTVVFYVWFRVLEGNILDQIFMMLSMLWDQELRTLAMWLCYLPMKVLYSLSAISVVKPRKIFSSGDQDSIILIRLHDKIHKDLVLSELG